jgi:hypothetical protein
MNVKARFLTFFSLIGLTGVLSILDSWLIQSQVHGQINLARAVFQICLLALVLYLLWGRKNPAYILSVFYVVGNAALYGYELIQFFVLGNLDAKLPTSATVISALLILAAISSMTLFALDYLDYRKRRVPVDR